MEGKRFVWDEIYEGLVLAESARTEDTKKKDKRRKTSITENKVYCPHNRLIFKFKDSLNFSEQSRFRKYYRRKIPSSPNAVDVVILQDVKDLVLYLIASPMSVEFLGFAHLALVDRFLRALLLYMQSYLTTWTELGEKRAATEKRAPNPLAGGARVQRSQELQALRCLLAREYCDLLMGCQKEAKRFHHLNAGETTFSQSKGEMDFRLYEGLIQFAHRVVWIALERKNKELIEIELHRMFRTEPFNGAKRKYGESGLDWEVPEDEYWILYGPKLPSKQKILRNSPLVYEILYTNCDYRLLTTGLSNAKSKDPRVAYLENALLAREEDLPGLGIKLGILGLPRSDFDALLIPQASEDDQVVISEDSLPDDEEGADDYETLMPLCGTDLELTIPFPMDRLAPRYCSDEEIRNASKKKWIMREMQRAAANYTEMHSASIILN